MRRGAKILLIDDEETIQDVITQFFDEYDCQISSALDGDDGIEMAGQEQYDLILLDLNMPRMHGMVALPRLIELNPDARVVIMTAYASYESKVEAYEKGAYDYLVKPITEDNLREVAERAIPERQQTAAEQEQAQSKQREGVEYVQIDFNRLDRDAAQFIPERIARAFCLLALSLDGNALTVAMDDPSDVVAQDTLYKRTGCTIRPVQADRTQILAAIDEAYSKEIDVDQSLLDLVTVDEVVAADEISAAVLRVESEDAPVIRLVDLILYQAIESGASDIHIEPSEHSVAVRIRIDGVMRDITAPPRGLFYAVVSRIKILASMDIAERRLPQDGRARVRFRDKSVDLRINTLPTVYGESVVMRLLDKSNLFNDITMLGFDEFHQNIFLDAISRPHGMIYLTGPTGSGKTTTLYSGIQCINSRERKIITVEEPVEYEISGINQVPVRSDIGLTFANALRAILRQDPDVIMVGETRDSETAEIAVRAALTGHLVFSTLHTNDAPSSVTRLVDLGIEPFLLSSSLNLVIAQRLIRRICTECKAESHPSETVLRRLEKRTHISIPDTLYAGEGCHVCKGSGYKGRMAIYEFLPISTRMRELIMNEADEGELREEAADLGCTTLLGSGIQRVEQGLTTMDEVLKITLEE